MELTKKIRAALTKELERQSLEESGGYFSEGGMVKDCATIDGYFDLDKVALAVAKVVVEREP